MKTFKGFRAAFVAAVAAAFNATPLAPLLVPAPHHRLRAHGAKKRSKTGRSYPHSSTRQQARYRRQIAAGQLKVSV